MTITIPDRLIPQSPPDRPYRFQLIVWKGTVANLKGYVEQISHPAHGPQGVWRLTRAARQEAAMRKQP